MLGRAAVAMWWDVPREVQAEWEDWHTREHMPERLAIPGFLRGSRWVAGSSYFVLYEAQELSTLTTGAYVERLNDPTPWSRKMMPHHRNMVRSLCLIRTRVGAGLGHAMATVRFSQHAPPRLEERKGVTAMQLLESVPPSEMPRTEEQKIRGGDARADRILLVCGYDVEAVQATARELAPPDAVTGVYRLAFSLTAEAL